MDNIKKLQELLPKVVTPDYSHIDLTPEETERALNHFRMLKSRDLEEKEEQENYKRKKAEAQRPWTYDEMMDSARERASKLPYKFVIDKNNDEVFHLLCLYFSNDPAFENEAYVNEGARTPYRLNKGIALYSPTRGNGKTEMLKLFQVNKRSCFHILPTERIASLFQNDGEEVIERYSQPWRHVPGPTNFYQNAVGIAYDDLGYEDVKNHYGNKQNVMLHILRNIYQQQQSNGLNFSKFHITTNLNGPQIQDKYDVSIRSRMREMFNWIEMKGSDRRK